MQTRICTALYTRAVTVLQSIQGLHLQRCVGPRTVAAPLDLQRPAMNSLADWPRRLGLFGNTNNYIYLYNRW